jgi:ribosome biogenesis GTPase / thiamine phosphate phosphatase
MVAQANFVRVRIERLDPPPSPPEESRSTADAIEDSTVASLPPPPLPRLLCTVRGLLKKMKRQVLVGDNVRVVGIDWISGRGAVEAVIPRRSVLREPPVANVTHVLLVFSLAKPPFQPDQASRFLLSAESAGLPVVVALNKADLVAEEEANAAVEQLSRWGYFAAAISVVDGRGVAQLAKEMAGKVTVVAGPSGAGKSSIINALKLFGAGMDSSLGAGLADDGEDSEDASSCKEEEESEECKAEGAAEESGSASPRARPSGRLRLPAEAEALGLDLQAVGVVSERIGRGKHTTRNVALLDIGGGGFVADTPGFNQPDLDSTTPDELASLFPEFRALIDRKDGGGCTFSDCQHLVEPGCVVRDAGLDRYDQYVKMHAEMKEAAVSDAARTAGKRLREGMVRVKSRGGGRVGEEARLEAKSHRRVSRRSVKQAVAELTKDVEADEDVPR